MRTKSRSAAASARFVITLVALGLAPAIGSDFGPASFALAAAPAPNGPAVLFEFVRLPGRPVAEADAAAVLRHLHAQAVVLGSRPILERVVQEPAVRDLPWTRGIELDKPQGLTQAVEKLRSALTITVRPESGLISAAVRMPGASNADEVALANTLADVYALEGQRARATMEAGLERVLVERLREIDAELGSLSNLMASQIRSRGPVPRGEFWSAAQVELEETARALAALRTQQPLPDAQQDLAKEAQEADPKPDAPAQANTEALQARIAMLRGRVDELELRLRDEADSALNFEALAERRTALLNRRARNQDRLDDLQAVIASGPTVRVLERPVTAVPAEKEV